MNAIVIAEKRLFIRAQEKRLSAQTKSRTSIQSTGFGLSTGKKRHGDRQRQSAGGACYVHAATLRLLCSLGAVQRKLPGGL
jgi:hypothetical protein